MSSDPLGGKTPEQFLASFVSKRPPADPEAFARAEAAAKLRRAEELAAEARRIHDAEAAPQATLLGRTYEPAPMWVPLLRSVRGAGRSERWGIRHHRGRWHPQSYMTELKARGVADALTLLWLIGTETPLVVDFTDARGEDETVEEWKHRQGIGAVWCGLCPNPRQPDPEHHPGGQEEHAPRP